MSEGNEHNDNGGEQTPPETSWINSDGSFGDLSKAPQEVGEFITKKGFKDIGSMTKSHRELETMMGNKESLIRIPEAGDDVGFRTMATKLGCPLKPEDYIYEGTEGDPMDDNLLSLFKQSAHKDGMPQNAFQDVVRFQVDAIKLANKTYEDDAIATKAKDRQTLRDSFEDEEKYNAYTQKALGFADKFKLKDGTTSAADVLERKGLAYDREILEIFSGLADSVQEDSFTTSRTRIVPDKDQQLASIKAHPAFCDAMHPEHGAKMEEYWELFNLKPQKG
jgi:hypothetical protein